MSFLRMRRKFVGGTAQPARAPLQIQPRNITVQGVTSPGEGPIALLPFTSSFEGGNTSEWTSGFQGGTITVNQNQAYDGTFAMSVLNVVGGNDDYVSFLFGDALQVGGAGMVAGDNLWLRFAYKWGSNWQDNGYNSLIKVMLMNAHNPTTGARMFQTTLNYYVPTQIYSLEFLNWTGVGSFNLRANIDLSGPVRVLNQWVEFVMHWRLNSVNQSDGLLEIWSKSEAETFYTKRMENSAINFNRDTGVGYNRLIVANYQPDGVISGNRYWDYFRLQEETISTPVDPGGGGGDEFFQMDYSSGAANNAGWSLGIIDVESNIAAGRVALARVASIGPTGQAGYRVSINDDGTDQFSTAWHGYPYNGSQAGPGDEIFFRFRYRPLVPNNGFGTKIYLQQAEDNPEQSRVGLILQPWNNGYTWRGTHGGDLICQTPGDYTDWNQWSTVQFSLTFHTPGNQFNGIFKIWRNNNVYASPTVQAVDTQSNGIKAVANGSSNYYCIWSASTHNPSGSDFSYEFTDYEIGPTFQSM
jgi:hypothetical protein